VSPATHFRRELLPPARQFYEAEGFRLGRANRKGWMMAQGQPICHKSKSGRSFSVNLDGGFYCHGCGTGGGDIIDYVALRDHLSKKESAIKLGCYDESPSLEDVRRWAAQTRERDRRRAVEEAEQRDRHRRVIRLRDQLHDAVHHYQQTSERLSELRRGAVPEWQDEQESCWASLAVTLGDWRDLERAYCAAATLEYNE
jgi:hypothetical protein